MASKAKRSTLFGVFRRDVFTNELLAGFASFETARAYEAEIKRNGKPASYAQAEVMFGSMASHFVDREEEKKAMDFLDKDKAKQLAKEVFTHKTYNYEDGLVHQKWGLVFKV
ncbi:DUF3759 domain-containing protein [Aspergillus undulatus]|uniref:DUF3759 domain-containing protein n=1 Tax=Aspergillus undulatus TaxID=1810928 RepID=UPI003CCD8CF9